MTTAAVEGRPATLGLEDHRRRLVDDGCPMIGGAVSTDPAEAHGSRMAPHLGRDGLLDSPTGADHGEHREIFRMGRS